MLLYQMNWFLYGNHLQLVSKVFLTWQSIISFYWMKSQIPRICLSFQNYQLLELHRRWRHKEWWYLLESLVVLRPCLLASRFWCRWLFLQGVSGFLFSLHRLNRLLLRWIGLMARQMSILFQRILINRNSFLCLVFRSARIKVSSN